MGGGPGAGQAGAGAGDGTGVQPGGTVATEAGGPAVTVAGDGSSWTQALAAQLAEAGLVAAHRGTVAAPFASHAGRSGGTGDAGRISQVHVGTRRHP